jgi:hypothetical protein
MQSLEKELLNIFFYNFFMCYIIMEEEFIEPVHQYLDLQINQGIYIYKDSDCDNNTIYVNNVVNKGTYEIIGNCVNKDNIINIELLVNDNAVSIHSGINTINQVIELDDMELLHIRYSTTCNIQTSIFINRIA